MTTISNISYKAIFRVVGVVLTTVAIIYFIALLRVPLTWIVISFFLAIGLNPAVSGIATLLPGKRRILATLIAFLFTIAVLGFVIFRLIPPLVQQTIALVQSGPQILNYLQTSGDSIPHFLRDIGLVSYLQANAGDIISFASHQGTSFLGGAVSGIGALATILTLTFYILVDGPRWIDRARKSRFGSDIKKYDALAAKIYQAITGYVTGNILISIIAGSTAALTLWLVGAPYPVPLAFLYGVLDLLPLVGATIGGILLVTVALFNSVTSAVIVLAYVIIYQQIENSLLQPLIYGRAIRLEAFVVLVAVIIGAALGGVVGALLAIPIAACVEVAIKFYLGTLEA